jgi:small-conductance mechanosensitive channel
VGAFAPLTAQVVAGLVLLGLAGATRAFTRNRVVRSRVRLTVVLALVLIAVNVALAVPGLLRPETRLIAISVSQLVLAFALIHFIVLVAVNPLRVDRVPERFPTLVQDVIVFTVWALVATLVMEEKFLTTSAVGAIVAGLALQDTLGNVVSGLALQVEKPFQLGHWVVSGDWEGEVTEITWRAVKLRTRQGNQVIIPNAELAKSAIVNYSEPAAPTRIEVDVGTSYDDPPNRVKAVLYETLDREPRVLKAPAPLVRLVDFADSSLTYRAHFWIDRLPDDEVITDRVRTAIYYALRRHHITIPYPIQVEYGGDLQALAPPAGVQEDYERALGLTDLFGLLGADDRRRLVELAEVQVFGEGEAIVRQGDADDSAYVILEGRVRVSVEPGDTEVAVIDKGGYFGEMSLLTGEPRTATVRALADCRVLEIEADDFRRFVLENPSMVEQIGAVVAERRSALARTRDAAAATVSPSDDRRGLVSRMRKFFGV